MEEDQVQNLHYHHLPNLTRVHMQFIVTIHQHMLDHGLQYKTEQQQGKVSHHT